MVYAGKAANELSRASVGNGSVDQLGQFLLLTFLVLPTKIEMFSPRILVQEGNVQFEYQAVANLYWIPGHFMCDVWREEANTWLHYDAIRAQMQQHRSTFFSIGRILMCNEQGEYTQIQQQARKSVRSENWVRRIKEVIYMRV